MTDPTPMLRNSAALFLESGDLTPRLPPELHFPASTIPMLRTHNIAT